MSDDLIETHHRNGNHNDNTLANLALLHGHCHDEVHQTRPALSAVEGYSSQEPVI